MRHQLKCNLVEDLNIYNKSFNTRKHMSKDERLDHFQLYNQENFREKVATELAVRDVQEFFRVEISILSLRLKNLDLVLQQRKTKLLQIRKD